MSDRDGEVIRRGRLFWVIPQDSEIRRDGIRDFEDFGPRVRAKYDDAMNCYFEFPRSLYPEKKAFKRIRRHSFRYFRIAENDTESMFPIDEDIRRCIDDLRRTFIHDVVRYIVIKRLWLILFFAAMVASIPAMESWLSGVNSAVAAEQFFVAGKAAAFAIITALALVAIASIFLHYKNCLDTSANAVGSLVEHRMSDLKLLLSELTSAMHTLEATRVAQWDYDWPGLAAHITKLIIWVSKRMEYIEKYMQMEMWRISRSQWRARMAGYVIAGITLAGLLGYAYHFGLGLSARKDTVLAASFWVLCSGVWIFSTWRLSAESRTIQNTLEKHVTRITEARLDNIIGSLIKTDKDKIMTLSHPAEAARPRQHREQPQQETAKT